MTGRGTLLLAIVAALVGGLLVIDLRRTPSATPAEVTPLLEDPDAVAAVEIGPAGDAVEFSRGPAGWGVRAGAGNAAHVPDLLEALHTLRPLAEVETAPADPAAYGLDTTARRLRIVGDGGTSLLALEIGAANPARTAVYARRNGRPEVDPRRRPAALGAGQGVTRCPGSMTRNHLQRKPKPGNCERIPVSRLEEYMNLVWRFSLLGVATMTLVLGAAGAPAQADDKPWVLDANNWQEGKDLLPEPVLKRLEKGEYWFNVVPVDPEEVQAQLRAEVLGRHQGERGQVRGRREDAWPEGQGDRQDSRLRPGPALPDDRPEGPPGGNEDRLELHLQRQPGRRRRRDLHAERHRHQRRVPQDQGVPSRPDVPGTPRTARTRTTPRTSRTRRSPRCSSPSTSRASPG